jgi:hypothetical protein
VDLNYEYDAHSVFTWRKDFMADSTCQRTGFKGNFLERTLGYMHRLRPVLSARPGAHWSPHR